MPPRAKLDGRWIAAAIVLAFCFMLKLGSLATGRPIFELPPFSWIGPMAPYFADLRGVVSWSDQFCTSHVTDIAALRDPWGRPMNYPSAWLYLHDLGINTGNVMTTGWLIIAAYFLAAFFVLGPLDISGGLIAGLFLISYAVMFGVVRANVDLAIFALLAIALALRRIAPAAALIISLAAILKLHPVFALGALLRPPWKRTLPWLAAGLLLFALSLAIDAHALLSSAGNAPNMRSGTLSFGTTTFGLELGEWSHRPSLGAAALAGGVIALILLTGLAARLRPHVELAPENERELFAFRIGAGIYLGSYLLGTNHDYRAACLLFCLPLLLLLWRGPAPGWSRATLLLLLISVNWLYLAGDNTPLDFLLKQAIAWALFYCLLALYLSTLQWPRRPPPL